MSKLAQVCFRASVVVVLLFLTVEVAKSQSCRRRNLARLEEGRECNKACVEDSECGGKRRRCVCDDHCGFSCLNPEATCRLNETFPNGKIAGERVYGSTITYTCNEGFLLRGSRSRTCRSDRKWSGVEPGCYAGCNEPSSFGFAFPDATKKDYAVGETLDYVCRFGFVLSGNPRVTCQDGGEWTDLDFVCLRRDCGDPGRPRNGFLVGEIKEDSFKFGSRIEFGCNTGYELAGPARISCDTTGRWSRGLPECEIVECGVPQAPEHGSLDLRRVTEFVYNTEVPYRCDRGYKLVGNEFGRCDENESWGELPVCEIDTDCNFEDPTQPTCSYVSKGVGWIRTFSSEVPNGLRGYVARSTLRQRNTQSTFTSQRIPQENSAWCLRFYYKVDAIGQSSDFQVSTVGDGDSRAFWSFNNEYDPKRQWLSTDYLFTASRATLQIEFKTTRSFASTAVDIDDITVTKTSPEDCVNECEGSTCQNGGTCLNRIDGFTCYCADGYEGKRCEIEIRCRIPPAPRFGVVTPRNRREIGATTVFYDEEIEYSCRYKYRFARMSSAIERINARCLLTRRFTREPPTCEEIRCQVPRNLRNVRYSPSGSSFTLDDVITYRCFDRYRMVGIPSGEVEATCRRDSSWSSRVPTCVEIDCAVNRPRNGDYRTNSRFTKPREYIALGGSITYVCFRKYEMVNQPSGRLTVTCQENRRWSSALPNCMLILCDVPRRLQFGRISTTERQLEVDERFTYRCNAGYRMEGRASDSLEVTCQRDGSFSAGLPTCSKIHCPLPEPPRFGSINRRFVEQRAGLGDRIEYRCREKYRLEGATEATCQRNDRWTDGAPTCAEIHCPLPESPQFGSINRRFVGERAGLGDRIEYRCRDKYRLEGATEATCQRNNRWSADAPTCAEITCPRRQLTRGLQADVNKGRWVVDDTVAYTCVGLRRLVGQATSTCQRNGQWRSSLPSCVDITCDHRDVPASSRADSNQRRWSPGDTVTYTCAVGYELTGEATAECLDTGDWSHGLPECDRIQCPHRKPSDDVTYVPDKDTWFYDETVTYNCADDLRLEGEPTSTCQLNKTWSSEVPTCVGREVFCDFLGTPEFATASSTKARWSHDEEVTYACDEERVLVGEASLTCQEGGEWSGELPECEASCNHPGTPDFATASSTKQQWRVDEEVTHQCVDGFALRGEASATCQEGGGWSNPLPTCEESIRSCPDGYNLSHHLCIALMRTRSYERAGQRCADDDATLPVVRSASVSRVVLSAFGDDPVREFWVGLRFSPDDARYVWGTGERFDPTEFSHFNRTPSPESPDYCVRYRPRSDDWRKVDCASFRRAVCMKWSADVRPVRLSSSRNDSTDYNGIYVPETGLLHSGAPVYRLMDDERQVFLHRRLDQNSQQMFWTVGKVLGVDESLIFVLSDASLPQDIREHWAPTGSADAVIIEVYTSWDLWSDWGRCSKSCGGGDQFRRRMCLDDNLPGSIFCVGSSQQRRPCHTERCLAECVVQAPDNGSASPDQVAVLEGASVIYSCDDGFELEGHNEEEIMATCRDDGTFDAAFPRCVEVTCSVPQPPQGVAATSAGQVPVEGKVTYTCEDGFVMTGQPSGQLTVTCRQDGTWTEEVPQCDRECNVDDALRFSSRLPSDETVVEGAEVTYECDDGYTITGDSSTQLVLTCRANGTMSGEPPECVEASCVPTAPEFGRVSENDRVRVGEEATYRCLEGYRMVGSERNGLTVTCGRNGEWSEPLPTCRRFCDLRPALQHSSTESTGLFVYEGEAVIYTCDEGYEIASDSSTERAVNCNDGVWSASQPQCSLIPVCEVPEIPSYLLNNTPSSRLNVGEHVWYWCMDGYVRRGGNGRYVRVDCLENGEWSAEVPQCRKIGCSIFDLGSNVEVDTEEEIVEPGTSVTYSCDEGYRVSGSQAREVRSTCQDDESWTTDPPRCVEIRCAVPQAPPNVRISPRAESVSFGDDVTYTCDRGYEISGNDTDSLTVTCGSNGQLSERRLLSCIGSWGIWENWQGCSVTCGGGLRRRIRSCPAPIPSPEQCVGEASQQEVCKERDCPRARAQCGVPQAPRYGTVRPRSGVVLAGQQVTFTCNQGFEVTGRDSRSVVISCGDNGRLSSPFPTCVALWMTWGSWQGCTVSCGGGSRTRRRLCPVPPGSEGECVGSGEETRQCNEQSCQQQGNWGRWGRWSQCSSTCGVGRTVISRRCLGSEGATCPGLSMHVSACNVRTCRNPPDPVDVVIGRKVYTIVRSQARYFTARDVCRRSGRNGNLAMIRTQAVQDRLTAAINELPGTVSYYLGMYGRNTRSWAYTDGGRVPLPGSDGFQNWDEGEPNNYNGNEHCGEMLYPSGKWNDGNCGRSRYYICQRDITNPCQSSPCLNEGTCHERGTDYSCECPQHVSGVNCEKIDSLCVSSPCQNGGTCSGDESSYTCECARNYAGDNCSREVRPCDSSPCLNGGLCNNVGSRYICGCTSFYSGDNCETVENLCVSSPCQNGGRCRGSRDSYDCSCSSGYGGKDCLTEGCRFDESLVHPSVQFSGRSSEFYEVGLRRNVTCVQSNAFLNVALTYTECRARNRWIPEYGFFECLPTS